MNGGPEETLPGPLAPFSADARRTLVLAGLAAFLASYGGSVLFFALPAVAQDFHARLQGLANLGSLLALGALAALPLASLADRWGRRPLLVASVVGFSLADIASAFTGNLGQLAVARVPAVCFEELCLGLAAVMVVEEVPAQHRALSTSVVAVAAGLGTGLTTILYPLLAPDWRAVYLPAAAGLPAALALWRWLPEGRTWSRVRTTRPALSDVARAPFGRRLLILAATGLLGAALFEPANLFGAFYGSAFLRLSPGLISLVVAVSGPLSGAAFLVGGWISDRMGRKSLGVLLSAAGAMATALTFTSGLGGYWAGNVSSGIAVGALSPVFTAWTAELLPTRARATGETIVLAAAAIGGAVGLQLVGLLAARFGFSAAVVAMLLPALIGAALLLLLPETRGQRLPD